MTETVDDLVAQLAKLNAARASGTSSVSYVANGVSRTVTWKSDIEMRGAQLDLQQRIAALLYGGQRRTILISTSKGLGRHGRPNLSGWLVSDAEKAEWEREHQDDD